MSNPVVVEVLRGERVESAHRGAGAVVDADGRMVFAFGDVDRPVYPRSAVKALQALPLIESGAADRFGLGDKEIALACASHSGEEAQVALAGAMLAKAGRDEACSNAARTGRSATPPPARSPVLAEARRPLHNNCSGKHAGFVCVACAAGIEPKGYVAWDHPVQREVSAALADVTQARLDEGARGVDGCSIPAYAIPLRALAHGFARFATGRGLSAERAKAAARIRAAVAAHPATGRRRRSFRHRGDDDPGRPRFHQDGRRGSLLRRAAGTRAWACSQGRRRRRARGAGDDRGAPSAFRRIRRGAERQARAFRRAPAPQLERRRGRRAPAGRTAGGSRSLTVVWRSGRGRIMRLGAFAVLAVLATAGAAHAADPCLNVGRKISDLKSDDAFQAASLLFAAARLGCEREARTLLDRRRRTTARLGAPPRRTSRLETLPQVLEIARNGGIRPTPVSGNRPLASAP